MIKQTLKWRRQPLNDYDAKYGISKCQHCDYDDATVGGYVIINGTIRAWADITASEMVPTNCKNFTTLTEAKEWVEAELQPLLQYQKTHRERLR